MPATFALLTGKPLHNSLFCVIINGVETIVNRDDAELPLPLGVSHYLQRAHKAVRTQLALNLERHGISMKHYHFLRVLQYEDGITQVELSRRIGVERATVTIVLEELERLGYVRRTQSKLDRRKMHVHLTPKGRRTRSALAETIIAAQNVALCGITADDYAAFKILLDKIVTNCDAHRASELERAAS